MANYRTKESVKNLTNEELASAYGKLPDAEAVQGASRLLKAAGQVKTAAACSVLLSTAHRDTYFGYGTPHHDVLQAAEHLARKLAVVCEMVGDGKLLPAALDEVQAMGKRLTRAQEWGIAVTDRYLAMVEAGEIDTD